jgi:hypothetical protein
MVDANRRTNGLEFSPSRRRRKPPVGVLRPGVQAEGLERSLHGSRAGHRACA